MHELNIGGSNMTVELRENTLYAEANTGNKQRVAVLSDTNAKVMTDGGEEIRESNEVRHSDDEVRRYSADGHLYAYRDGDEHVVVSRGNDPGTKWDKRVPSTVERPIPSQKLWTIPDNWEKRAHSKRDSIAYGLFYVPDSDVWVRVSIPTNNWLTDAWYQVKTVGDLDAEPVGELGSSYDVRRLADEYEEKYDTASADEDAEAIREVARNWGAVEKDLRRTIEWVRTEGLDDQPIPVDSDWRITFHQDRIFRPGEILKQAIDFSDYDIPISVILEELRDAGLLPSYYSFNLTFDESAIDMEYYIQGLIEAGASPAEAVDYYMVEIADLTQTGWAEERGVDQSTVSGNVGQAKDVLE